MLLTNKNHLIAMLSSALQGLAQERGLGEVPTPRLERPKAVDHGDVACNIALQLSKAWKLNPRELAQTLVERLQQQPGFDRLIASCEIAGPGFINFRLSNAAKTAVVGEILSAGAHFGELIHLLQQTQRHSLMGETIGGSCIVKQVVNGLF